MELPVGTVTFFLTDVEGSTRLWEQQPVAMGAALARHDALIGASVAAHGGTVIKSRGEGDALFAVFARASDGVAGAVAAQLALQAEPWPAPVSLRVRMALHTGEAELREGDYFGPAVNRAARLRAVAHGGQVLLSEATAVLVRPDLPAGAGLRPLGSHRLKDLAASEAISQLTHAELPATFQPLRSLDALPNNLPVQVSHFIGRDEELVQIRRLLDATRLLTLTGAGGTGKTRLALQAAADALDAFPDGVWLVELAALADPAAVPQAAAMALAVREEPGRSVTASLCEHLRDRQTLLLLDNCEHLVGACAALASALLRACPRVQIVTTSREALAIAGETTWQVPPLGMPDRRHLPPVAAFSQYAAVRLFIDRAAAARPGFTVTSETAPAVAEICWRLDGIPLAIELAAARVKVLSPDEIRRRLDDRFRLLTGGDRTALPRQQTLRALVDWSHDLLSEPERTLWRRLAAFAGPFSLAAAEAVAAGEGIESYEVLDLLAVLVEKSLVVADDRSAEMRYRLLETIRGYGEERLRQADEEAAVRDRHQQWYLGVAEEMYKEHRGPRAAEWIARLEAEYDNVRAALAWAEVGAEAAARRGLRLASRLIPYWMRQGYFQEGREQLAAAIALRGASDRTEERAMVLNGLGHMAGDQGDLATAETGYSAALAIARELDSPQRVAMYLVNLGGVLIVAGEFDRAEALFRESQATCSESAEYALAGLAQLFLRRGDLTGAAEQLGKALSTALAHGNRLFEPAIIALQTEVALLQNDLPRARRHLEEARALMAAERFMPDILTLTASVARRSGDLGVAAQAVREALQQQCEAGTRELLLVDSIAEAAMLLGEQGRAEPAVRLLAAAAALSRSLAVAVVPQWLAEQAAAGAGLRQELGEAAYTAEWAAGEQMSVNETFAYAEAILSAITGD